MDYIIVKNLEKYHPSYKDRNLIWFKCHFSMVNSDPEFEMVCEIDKWRFICFIMLQLQSGKPVPISSDYLSRKGFDLKKRPIELTIQMLHNFLELVTEDSKVCALDKRRVDKIREEKNREDMEPVTEKVKFLDFVYLTNEEHQKLISQLGEENVSTLITRLNLYVGSKGKSYKSHYYTILNWANKEGMKKPFVKGAPKPVVEPVIERWEPTDENRQKVKEELAKVGVCIK
jgi:hypothetical protein